MTHNFLKDIDHTWTLFLDRDGVINKRIFGGYVTNPNKFEFLPGVLDSLAFFSSIFKRIIVITNQQGVGKGIMTEAELIALHNHMISEIKKAGGKIDGIYYCTNLAETPDNCRKPSVKMAHKAISDFPEINMKKSIMVGDSQCDIEFGNNAGMNTVFVTNESGDKIPTDLSDLNVNSLSELKFIIKKRF